MNKLAYNLMRKGYLKTDRIIDAFSEISRVEFVPGELYQDAEMDIALPIGFGQTISQPLVVAFMLELLEPKKGQKILDVGSGSGWTTSLLAFIVGKKGRVVALERIRELKDFGEKNADKYGYVRDKIAEFHNLEGSQGFSEEAPYDRILVSASLEEVPPAFKKQLKIGGKMVIPIRNSIFYFEKKSETDFFREEFPGFYFVPFVKDK